MKKILRKFSCFLLSLIMINMIFASNVYAATCNAVINFKIIPVYEDSSKPLGYDVDYGSAITKTFPCQYTSSHSTNANHSIQIKNWHPDNLGWTIRSGYQWNGWIKYTQNLSLNNVKNPPFSTFYNWTSTTTDVSGTGTHYIYLVYKNPTPTNDITLSYNGNGSNVSNVPNSQTQKVNQGAAANFTVGNAPTRPNYIFQNWNTNKTGTGQAYNPQQSISITTNTTLYAIWKEDRNNNNIADDEEDKYTVTYTDGVDGEVVFEDQITTDLLLGDDTPDFNGTPSRDGYIFKGWTPAVSDKVTGDAVYTAIWKEDKNNNNIADDEEDKYTVTYTDGVDGEVVFEDQITTDLLLGDDTPDFNGTPSRDGYVFKGWTPAVSDKVTGDAVYTAVWEKINDNDPVDPIDPTKPVDPTDPIPTDPTDPVIPVDPSPTDPTDPVVPVDPTPTVPTDLVVSADPTPTVPTDPVVSADPTLTDPADSVIPADSTPTDSTKPVASNDSTPPIADSYIINSVEKTKSQGDQVKTDDNSNIILWLELICLSVTVIYLANCKKKKLYK